MTSRGRGLDKEEKKLWERVRHSVTPLHLSSNEAPTGETDLTEDSGKAAKKPKPAQMATAKDHLRPAQRGAGPATVELDRKKHTHLKRGKLKPEATLDLHGKTADQAHASLISFILDARSDGKRLVLVITGKGRNSRDEMFTAKGEGILKRSVPMWLSSAPLAKQILTVTDAHMRHGGSGALYVYLRRNR